MNISVWSFLTVVSLDKDQPPDHLDKRSEENEILSKCT